MTSAFAPTSAINSLILAFRSFTMLKTAGLFAGSKASLMERTEPSSTGMHFTAASFLPRSRISASFHELAHSKKTSTRLVSFSPEISDDVGSKTSGTILAGGSAPKAATICLAASVEVIGFSALTATAQSASLLNCCTRIAGSDSTLRPGLNSNKFGSPSTQRQGATAHTNLWAEGKKTSFRTNNCVGFCPSAGVIEGVVDGTQEMACKRFIAAILPPRS
mmetsp:Transcript_93353/g.302094  ORF Transcript_93353/g.302094 Transcript_93353/m.302094 type:complete len:220 (+) Transcript_93353:13230-13889(+)